MNFLFGVFYGMAISYLFAIYLATRALDRRWQSIDSEDAFTPFIRHGRQEFIKMQLKDSGPWL